MTTINNPLLLRPRSELPRWVGIVGAGSIGADIGYLLKAAIPGLHLVMVDAEPSAIDRALENIRGRIAEQQARGALNPAQAEDLRQALMGSTDFEALAYCDWVIETAGEDLDVKRGIYARIESIVRGSALITSAIGSHPAARLFDALERPERATLTHFVEPVQEHSAVEVVAWERCAPEVVDYLRWLFCVIGKVPVLSRDEECGMPDRAPACARELQRQVLQDMVDGVLIITLRRADALHALNDEMADAIIEALRDGESDQGLRGFILTGYGTRAFSASADVGRFKSMLGDRERSADYARSGSRLLLHIDSCAKPVVAAVNGIAQGGGLELALRCHGFVATGNAWMQFPEITLGIVPGGGAMTVPYRRWPQASAAFHAMLTRAEKVGAEQFCELGIVDTLVDDHANLIPAALWRVNDLQEHRHRIPDGPIRIAPLVTEVNAPVSVSGQRLSADVLDIMRHAIQDAARAATVAEALEIGYQAFGESACTPAAQEGISAFGEHRRPDFAKTG